MMCGPSHFNMGWLAFRLVIVTTMETMLGDWQVFELLKIENYATGYSAY